VLGLSFHILSTTSCNNLPPYPARVVNALLIGLKTVILTVLKSSLAHALNRETLPLIYEIHIFELRIKIKLCEDHRNEGVST